jgi:predicted nucleic acid-binding protein
LALVAQRQCRLVLTAEILAEYETRVPSVLATESRQAPLSGALAWVRSKALWVEPAPLGKRRSRDFKDDRFIAAALAASAKAIVSYDRDLLDLGKPFGIPVMRPTAFLAWMEGRFRDA